jgi:hypothetical protein
MHLTGEGAKYLTDDCRDDKKQENVCQAIEEFTRKILKVTVPGSRNPDFSSRIVIL